MTGYSFSLTLEIHKHTQQSRSVSTTHTEQLEAWPLLPKHQLIPATLESAALTIIIIYQTHVSLELKVFLLDYSCN